MSLETPAPDRSYGCSFGDGNPYDFILVTVADATTLFLCLPCYLRTSIDVVTAVTQPDSPDVRAALAAAGSVESVPMTSGRVRKRGKNAPADVEDDGLIEAYDGFVTEDELPDEFR